MLRKIYHFFKVDLWRVKSRQLPRHKFFLFRLLRTFVLALRGYDEDKCQLMASALTFYTLLSIVPLLAMAFGIAKGFGFQSNLESLIAEKLVGQEEVARWIIEFSKSFLSNVRGGLIAGVGVVLLFWTVIKVLGNIEKSFNEIWGIKQERSFARKFSDYLSMVLICPILLIFSSSLTVFITTQLNQLVEAIPVLENLTEVILLGSRLVPLALVWFVFTFIYVYMPNTKVSFKAGFLAGIVAGILYQIVQWIYIYFQIGMTSYNAVYGSFAALPLFLVWLQTSWLIVLLGAEISFAFDNEATYEFEDDVAKVSLRFKRLVALRMTELCVKNFSRVEKPLDAVGIAHILDAPIRLVRNILYDLVGANVLSAVKSVDSSLDCYQPAQPLEQLTVKKVIELLDRYGQDDFSMLKASELEKVTAKLDALEKTLEASKENTPLRDL